MYWLYCIFLLSVSEVIRVSGVLNDRPRIRTISGHLLLEAAPGKNISLSTSGAPVSVNGLDVARSFSLLHSVAPQLQMLQDSTLNQLIQNLSSVAREVAQESHLAQTLVNIRGNMSEHKSAIESIRTRLRSAEETVTTLSGAIDIVNTVAGEDVSQRIANISNAINSLQSSLASAGSGSTDLSHITQRVDQIEASLSNLGNFESRIEALELVLNAGNYSSVGGASPTAIRILNRRIRTLIRKVNKMQQNLQRRECNSLPCRHGATCIDGYMSYQCLCRPGWTGPDCGTDVNECQEYQGTDLGCQNGATCVDRVGGYTCTCAPGYTGRHCTVRDEASVGCGTAGSTVLCDHGDCVPSGTGYTCRCHQGWTKAPGSTMCSQDVDECESGRTNHCSSNPSTQCINTPGSYVCGACPAGYTGDGFRCSDINECEMFNGGCSLVPRVQCINTIGGRQCGGCPAGYTGDGVTCAMMPRPCLSSPCHHLATCNDHLSNMLPNYYQCTCPPGYVGNGMGPYGCAPQQGGGGGGAVGNPCSPNPCLHGSTCSPNGNSFFCHCTPGYAGSHCQTLTDPCLSSPCQNRGTCTTINSATFTCACATGYTGATCTEVTRRCGGVLRGTTGMVHYPDPGIERYDHNISCAWVIIVPEPNVINVTFTEFHLESGHTCSYDWLQIHDGRRSTAHLIGRFCGNRAPGVNNTLISTHNSLYLWFRSDHSITGHGFTFNWTAQPPECGGVLRNQDHGSINSPGYPGYYPNNRNCSWSVIARPGKRILFHFATVAIEHHPNCSYDKLEIRDGLLPTSPLLGEFCSTQSPAPITSSGSEASIFFHTDESARDTGFHISYSSQPSIPGCGGVFTGDQGSFSAPEDSSGQYQHGLHCEWLIRVPIGETIELNVTSFRLEHGGRLCYFDYFEVRDGGDPESPVVGRYCGTNNPPHVSSSSNELFVVFHSDSSVSHSGFQATYQVACGGEYLDPTGIIRSPYHPNPYPHNRECIYVIRQPPGKAILLNFTSFDVEQTYFSTRCYFDYVEVRDGSSAAFPLLGHYCGPPSSTPAPVLSTHNIMWIKFKTDSSVANRGFVANYTTLDIRCGGVYTDPLGVVSSPNRPDTYHNNADCYYIIEGYPGSVVQITWSTFILENHVNCGFDFIEIFDNSSMVADSPAMGRGRYCGTNKPPTMTSLGNMITVHFHSDSSVNDDGFQFTYQVINSTTACGGEYHTQSGVFTSPLYPMGYPRSRTCEWIIHAPPNRQVALSFETFSMGSPYTPCRGDYIQIRNGGYNSAPIVDEFCGVNLTIPEIFSHSNQLYVKMVSDRYAYNTGAGFKAIWNTATTGCGGTLTSMSGEIISPGYPNAYHHATECYWSIRVSQGSKVSLHITDVDLQSNTRCLFDYIEVSDPVSGTIFGRYCISQQLITITGTSNQLNIKFRSNGFYGGRGFRALYSSECNTELNGPHGVIESPNFPRPYPHRSNCSWTIKAPRGNSIVLSFSHFRVENRTHPTASLCLFDYVEVRSGSQDDSHRVVRLHQCGVRRPLPVSSGEGMDVMVVDFVSDGSIAENGFRAEWQVVGCGGKFTKDRDSFTSPNYPNTYPANRDCEWHVESAPGTRLKITVHGYDIESATHTTECVFDALKIYGGPDTTSPVLSTLCEKKSSDVIVTTDGNTALLVMISDGSVRGNGFNISYETLPGGCGGTFTTPQGRIHSPNYPANYDHNLDCIWTITVDPLHVVVFNIEDFAVEHVQNCTYDYFALYDGNSLSDPELLRHCGAALPDVKVWRSSGNTLTVRFNSDQNVQSKGFSANYSTGCGARIPLSPGMSGYLQSPNYPDMFLAQVNCTWHLEASEGERIQLMINHLDIRPSQYTYSNGSCITDYIAVYDGRSVDSPEINRFCGSSAPLPVYSSSRSLTVKMFISMGYGVGFRGTYSELTTACGGELLSESGQLASPNYPEPYSEGYDCTWSINAGLGNKIQLSFNQFDIAESDHCNTDYVEVHQGSSTGPLLLHNCTNVSPNDVVATDSMWIRFRSGSSSSAQGFLASYALQRHIRLEMDEGTITSPLYPATYTGSGLFTWVIATQGNHVVVTVEQMNIEMDPVDDVCLSSLQIHDGAYSFYGQLAELCGYDAPTSPIISSNGVISVRLNANHRFEGVKFRLRFEAIMEPNATVQYINRDLGGVQADCHHRLTVNRSMRVYSPNYPQNYNNSLNCMWELEASPHNRVRISLYYELEESTNCVYDKLDIYNGVEGLPNWNRTHRLCNRSQQPRSRVLFVSDGRYARIHFITDSYMTAKGFRAYISPVCGGYLHEPEGVISSPEYPRNYGARRDCKWTIRVRQGKKIRLEFNMFNILNTTVACGGDYLLIRNGESDSSPYLGSGRFCGRQSPGTLISSSNVIKLQFVSDRVGSARGFHLTYYEESESCGGAHHISTELPEVALTTPNYPGLVNPHTECSWVVTAPHNKNIQIDFLDSFEIPSNPDGSCSDAWLELRDGGTELAPVLATLCGSSLPNSIKSSDSIIFLRYFGNITVPHHGFSAKASIGRCGGTINFRDSGVIFSPNYPRPYAENINCSWTLVGPVGHYISINFLALQIFNPSSNCSSNAGVLTISETTDEEGGNSTELSRSCGINTPAVVETASNKATIAFMSGSNPQQFSGFSLMYEASAEECGGEISGTSGRIQSPGYPHGYSHRRVCTWRIHAPEGKKVSLTIEDLDLAYYPARGRRRRRRCRDYVLLYNGVDRHAPFMGNIRQLCGTQPMRTYNSSMNGMKIIFFTRGQSTSRGFKASWTAHEDQECGGQLTGTSGIVSSPGLETGGYNHSLNCVWSLYNPLHHNSSIRLSVGHLHLERRCYDYILIQGVINGVTENFKKICQQHQDATFIVPYPEIRIVFITDYSVNMTGWNMSYSLDNCGGYKTGPTDVISSPNYPSNYPNDAQCAWIYNYEEGSQIDMNFTSFHLENSIRNDYVRIMNGRSYRSMVLGEYTGTGPSSGVGPSMSNTMIVYFNSDGSNTDRGFRLETRQHTAGCGGIYHGRSGNFSSPQFPSDYPDNIECTWVIEAHSGYFVKLSFVELFDIETSLNCTNDLLRVSSGILQVPDDSVSDRQMNWELKGQYCGKQTPAPLSSSGTHLKLLFRTNENVKGSGFKAQWETLCGGTYTSETGVISSPMYPMRYPRRSNCTYTIHAQPGSYVTLNFLNFTLEGSSSRPCMFDYLEITYKSQYRTVSEKHCGRDLPPTITGYGNVTLNFISDSSVQLSGFKANYTSKPCGGVLTKPGLVRLPMTDSYHNNMHCIWNVTAPAGKSIIFKFIQLHLERSTTCRFDGIRIFEGLDVENSNNLLGTFCGQHIESLPIVSTTDNKAAVQFYSDSSVIHAGFVLGVDFRTACSQTINVTGLDQTQVIHSPDVNNDGDYDASLHCRWVIVTAEDQVVAVNFTRFELEPQPENDTRVCPHDFLEITDGASILKEDVIFRGCGTDRPLAGVQSSGNVLSILFSSDSAEQRAGFTATISARAHPCGRTNLDVTSTRQTLTSPNYPNEYPVSILCRWTLTAPENDSIILHFDDLNLEQTRDCTKDQLTIINRAVGVQGIHTGDNMVHYTTINGVRVNFPYFFNDNRVYCGQSHPGDLVLNGNTIDMKFTSDEDTTGRGFKVHYATVGCNRTHTQSFGKIYFRSNYHGDTYPCTAVIQAPPGHFITVYFLFFYIDNTNECSDSYLKVYNGSSTSSDLLETMCGYQSPNPIYSTGNSLTLYRFCGNTPCTVNMYYSISDQPNGCGASVIGEAGMSSSPHFPSPAPPNMECVYTFTVPAPYHVHLRFNNLFEFAGAGGCNTTYLELYDVMPDDTNVFIARYCGQEMPAPHIASSNRAVLRYVTGSSVNGTGWVAYMRASQLHPDSPLPIDITTTEAVTSTTQPPSSDDLM